MQESFKMQKKALYYNTWIFYFFPYILFKI